MPIVTDKDTAFAERAASEQALVPVTYDLDLTLDTEADRLNERALLP